MPTRGAPRFAVEVLFLAALAAALAFARLRPAVIVAFMLAGWLVVALFEWGGARLRAHYGSGLPPRWRVPRTTLPPPRPLEQVVGGYPASEPLIEEATWIASPAMLADWPVTDDPHVEEATAEHDVLELEAEVEVEPEPEPVLEPVVEPEPESQLEPEPEPVPEPEILSMAAARFEKHRLDPFETARERSRIRSRRGREPANVEVPARPDGIRVLPHPLESR